MSSNTKNCISFIVAKILNSTIVHQLKLIKMRAELANLNQCAVPFSSRADVNLSWFDCTL